MQKKGDAILAYHNENLLFHYTSLRNAISILSTKMLIFSSTSNVNDINESSRSVFCHCLEDEVVDNFAKELKSYKQISLTCEVYPERGILRRGFDIAPMWGHYAEGGNGVCIVLNKNNLLQAAANMPSCHFGYVSYSPEYDCSIDFESEIPIEEMEQRIRDIFFCKSDQWQHEQEFRIVARQTASVDYLDLTNCIEAIIFAKLGASIGECVSNTKGCRMLKKVCGEIPLFGYDHCSINRARTIYRETNGQIIWSSTEIVDLESGGWRVG